MAALGFCKTCEGRVSTEALVCPHCGQPGPTGFGMEAQVRLLVKSGQKIVAIKLVRDQTKLGLREAKDFVEAL
jgi:hypothetical protein